MNWLTNFIRPRIRSIVGDQKDISETLWQKCPSCEGMLFHRDLEESLNVCHHCGHHMRLKVQERLDILFDGGTFEKLSLPDVPHDPLKFRDRKKYTERLKEARQKSGHEDAITLAEGTIGGQKVVCAAFNFSFMGGSMGAAVGEAIVKGAKRAVETRAAFLTIPASGGARMQEGLISLMQMPRTIIAVEMVKEARLPYLVLLTDPTTGGVSASFAMVGDIHLAEPGATIGFAGRRVIEETVRETLPDDFQTAEYLCDNGIVDMVVKRQELNTTIGRILNMLMQKQTRPTQNKAAPETKNDAAASKNPQAEPEQPHNNAREQAAHEALRKIKAARKAVKAIQSPDTRHTGSQAVTG